MKISTITILFLIGSHAVNAAGFVETAPNHEMAYYFNESSYTSQSCLKIEREEYPCKASYEHYTVKEYIVFSITRIDYFEFAQINHTELGAPLTSKYYKLRNRRTLSLPPRSLTEFSSFIDSLTLDSRNLNRVSPRLVRDLENLVIATIGPGIGYSQKDLGHYYTGILEIFKMVRENGSLKDIESICIKNFPKIDQKRTELGTGEK
jgi:hypothetical protein